MKSQDFGRPVRLRLSAAHVVLWSERLTQAFLPAAILVTVLAALALLIPAGRLALWLHLPVLAAGLAGVALLGVRGAAGLRRPSRAEAERRLERDAGLAHRPFATLRDRPATEGQQAAWEAHRRRAAASLVSLRVTGPQALLAARDPFALRAGAVLLLVAGVVIAGPHAGERLGAAFLPGLKALLQGPAVTVQAWIQPPAYTGLAPIFLPAGGGDITAPVGGKLSVSVTGGSLRPHLSAPGGSRKFEALGNDSYQASALLGRGGSLRITRFLGTVAAWTLTTLPNDPPDAAWAEPPGVVAKSLRTRLPWKASQRWGVAGLEAVLQPDGRPDLPPIRVRIPLQGAPKEGHGIATPDLSPNPYAGVAVIARLVATDVSGQQGTSAGGKFTLPARQFHHPLARAIADLRRRLALHPHAREEAAGDLAALADASDGAGRKTGIYLNIMAAAALLRAEKSEAGLTQAEERLWTAALDLDGALPDASQKALAEARDDLHRALEDRDHEKITDTELARKLEALREALDKRLQELGRQARDQGALKKFDPKTDHLSSSAMDRAIRKMEEAAHAGRMDEARQRMAELEKMLDKLNAAKIMTPEQAKQQEEAAKRGRQMMGAVQDLVKRETSLLDHAQTRAPVPIPDAPRPFPNFDFPGQRGTEDPGDQIMPDAQPPFADARQKGAGQDRDARTQRALRRALEAMKQGFGQSGAKIPKPFEQAGQDMEAAAGALSLHQDRPATEAISRAIVELQQGGSEMAKQMSKEGGGQMQLSLQPGSKGEGEGEGEGEESQDGGEGGQDKRGRDPLGRQVDGHGRQGDDPDLRVPDQMEQGRSRAIQDELRRRGADRARPKQELDYIDRLLKPF